MIRRHVNIFWAVTRGCILVIALTVAAFGQTTCFAEGFGSALSSRWALRTLESFVGPIFPCGGIGTTFRSELGTSLFSGNLLNAKLTGTHLYADTPQTLDLRHSSYLDGTPFLIDFYTNLRLWRFALRGTYSWAETTSKRVDFARVDCSGFSARGEMDLVQFCWLSVGPSVDVFFNDPSFEGSVVAAAPSGLSTLSLNVRGDKPIAVGLYLRYVPPEIFNFPLHIEVWAKTPYKGAKLKSYGWALAFRPQIYRFDLCARIIAETRHLKFGLEKNSQYELQDITGVAQPQKWEVDMEWRFFGLEVSAFF